MIHLLVALCLTGTLSQYSPGVMQTVVRVRQAGRTAYPLPIPLPVADGYLAVLDCAAIGQVWTAAYLTHTARLLVADCAGDTQTRQWMQRNRIVGEIDYETARRWGVVGRGARATICKGRA